MEPILGFTGNYRWLSNFFPLQSPIVDEYDGVYFSYETVEHAYQAMKTLDSTVRVQVMTATSPYSAKRKGRTIRLREDWESKKDAIMLELVRKKFYYNPELKRLLINTGESHIYEVNPWGDHYWGCDEFLEGENRLGEILMQVRQEVTNQF